MIIAIIGTRSPSNKQIESVKSKIDSLSENDIVISGCAYGIDAIALEYAFNKGIKTIGCIPWKSYNKDIQQYCLQIICLTQNDTKAYISVKQFHPNPKALSKAAYDLMARNYLIIEHANEVYAYPRKDKFGGLGGTGQGIRIAESLKIKTEIMEIPYAI